MAHSFSLIVWVRGGVPDRLARRQMFMCVCAERKEHKHFRPGARPGESVTGVTEKLFMCQIPQGPRHIKNTMVILIHYGGGKKNMTVVKHYDRVSETPCFPGEIHWRSPQIVS